MTTPWHELYTSDEKFKKFVLKVIEEENVATLSVGDRRDLLTQYEKKQKKQIQFEAISFDEIDRKIIQSNDVTGTLQTGWRREKDLYFSTAIFLRQHLSELKETLDDFMIHPQLRHMYISGPPGSGKTTYCLFYFMRYVVTGHNKKGLVVQHRDETTNEIMILEGQQIRRVAFKTHHDNMSKLLSKLIAEEGGNDAFDFCLLDGVDQVGPICRNIGSAITTSVGTKTKVIKITSLEFDIQGGESTGGIDGIDAYFAVNSWILSDYEAAINAGIRTVEELQRILCLDSDFQPHDEDSEMKDAQNEERGETKEVTLEWLISLLKRKYYYAGGSARFMFDYSMEGLTISPENKMSLFDTLRNRMTDQDWAAFAQLKVSSSSNSLISSHMQLVDMRYVPVSEYALRIAHQQCKSKLTASVRAAAESTGNPVLKGWAFQLEQLDVIEQMTQTDSSILVSEDSTLVLPIASGESTTYDGKRMKNISSDAFTIWCSGWNQGCFDVAFYNKSTLVTMNFTVMDRLSFKTDALFDLKNTLESSGKPVSSLTHIAVIEEKAQCDRFVFDTPEGVDKIVEKTSISVHTARSQKLTANIESAKGNRWISVGQVNVVRSVSAMAESS